MVLRPWASLSSDNAPRCSRAATTGSGTAGQTPWPSERLAVHTWVVPAPSECEFPALAPTTGYTRGCRCNRCVEAARAASRRSRQKHAREQTQRADERQQGWYSVHRDLLRARFAAAGAVPDSDALMRALRKDIAPRFVRGHFTEAEDRAIVAWRGTDLMLAVALGRTYDAVIGRKHRLRRAGRLWS